MIGLSTIIRRSASQVSCGLNDEVAILNLSTARYFGIDSVGAFVWQELQEPRSVAALCEAVAGHFEVTGATCEGDVVKFVTALHEAKLVELLDDRR